MSAQEDTSVVYVTVGHTKDLYDLLVSKKIRKWIALGALGANDGKGQLKKDWNFFFHNTAEYTEYLVRNFPRPIYFVDGGSQVMTGKSLKKTTEGNIVRRAYEDWLSWYGGKTLDDQRPSWDLVTVFYAVKGQDNFFDEAEAGRLVFDAEEGCRWEIGEFNIDHHFIYQKEGTDSVFAEVLNGLLLKKASK